MLGDHMTEPETWVMLADHPPYQVSNLGRIKNRSGVVMAASTRVDGYAVVSLRVNGAQRMARLHTLVAKAFLPNPDNKPHVNHMNGIRDDNRVANLEWVTPRENNARKVFPNPTPQRNNRQKRVVQLSLEGDPVREWVSIAEAARHAGVAAPNITSCCAGTQRTAGGYRWAYKAVDMPDLPGEEWRDVAWVGVPYGVSSKGRVRLVSGAITWGSLCGGYRTCNSKHYVHRLVATAFVPNPDSKPFVNHKDGDRENNAAANLEWVTPKENSRHAVVAGLRGPQGHYTRPVRQLTLAGAHVAEFGSIAEASRATGFNCANIGSACRGFHYRSVGGFRWEYVERPGAPPCAPAAVHPPIADDDPLWAELGL